MAAVVWYAVMWAAASGDLMAVFFHMSLNDMIYIFRFLFFAGPIIAYIVTKRICLGLQRKDREIILHGYESGEIIRLPHGEYQERHKVHTDHEVWALSSFESPEYVPAEPDPDGKISKWERRRAAISKFFYEDRVAPVTKDELDAAHHDHGDHGVDAGSHSGGELPRGH